MKRFAAALGVAAVWFVPLAAQADPLDTPLPKAAWVKTIGSLRVEKYGQGAPALILVPGLGCGSWAFRDTVAREAPHHVIYSVTMAGTDGLPGGSDATLDNAEASIVTLIANEHLKMPVVVGHSLGGTLALRFGIDHGDLVKAIVSVDGTPVQPQFAMASAAERTAAAQQFYDVVSNQSQADYEKAEARYTADYVTDPALAAKVSTLVQRSDRKAVAEYGRELYLLDLRPLLPKLSVPTAEIAPIPGLPLPSYLPSVMATMSMDDRTKASLGFYRPLLAGTPNLTVIPVVNSRHFVMLDQPAEFQTALDGFLAGLP
jgi:pimeloyl-ACP methyl ester carboxylesterase